MEAKVRVAGANDASDVAGVLCRSIEELCHLDHEGDDKVVGTWLSNKTEGSVKRWIMSPDSLALVAETANGIVGIGMMDRHGEILLLYIAPEAYRQGVGSQLLRRLIEVAASWGLRKVTASSTATARGFYRLNGFVSAGEPSQENGLWAYPMEYDLSNRDDR